MFYVVNLFLSNMLFENKVLLKHDSVLFFKRALKSALNKGKGPAQNNDVIVFRGKRGRFYLSNQSCLNLS